MVHRHEISYEEWMRVKDCSHLKTHGRDAQAVRIAACCGSRRQDHRGVTCLSSSARGKLSIGSSTYGARTIRFKIYLIILKLLLTCRCINRYPDHNLP